MCSSSGDLRALLQALLLIVTAFLVEGRWLKAETLECNQVKRLALGKATMSDIYGKEARPSDPGPVCHLLHHFASKFFTGDICFHHCHAVNYLISFHCKIG